MSADNRAKVFVLFNSSFEWELGQFVHVPKYYQDIKWEGPLIKTITTPFSKIYYMIASIKNLRGQRPDKIIICSDLDEDIRQEIDVIERHFNCIVIISKLN